MLTVTILSLLSACGEAPPEEAEQVTLPVSVNEVMASLINHSADPIWIAAWRNPRSERDWRELEHLARQLQLGGALLTIPGTGPVDRQWTDDPRWQTYSMQLADAAERAANAARTQDVQLISRAGDEIVEVCESCHIDFKPDLPTMNIYGELSPTADDF
ncbi:MAG: cytochrome c [Pseudohongiellaceae bacterium]